MCIYPEGVRSEGAEVGSTNTFIASIFALTRGDFKILSETCLVVVCGAFSDKTEKRHARSNNIKPRLVLQNITPNTTSCHTSKNRSTASLIKDALINICRKKWDSSTTRSIMKKKCLRKPFLRPFPLGFAAYCIVVDSKQT